MTPKQRETLKIAGLTLLFFLAYAIVGLVDTPESREGYRITAQQMQMKFCMQNQK